MVSSKIIVVEEGAIPVGSFVILVFYFDVVLVEPLCEVWFSVFGVFLVEGPALHVVKLLLELWVLADLEVLEVLRDAHDVAEVRVPLLLLDPRYLRQEGRVARHAGVLDRFGERND